MSIPNAPERVNSLATNVGSSSTIDKALPPLDNFNSAYTAIRQIHDRLISLVLTLKGEDQPIEEQPVGPHCIQSMLNNMPDNIRNECHSMNDQITELEQILFT